MGGVRVVRVIVALKQQHGFHLQIETELRQADDEIGIPVDGDLLIGEEHVHEIGQRIEGNAPFPDERLGGIGLPVMVFRFCRNISVLRCTCAGMPCLGFQA